MSIHFWSETYGLSYPNYSDHSVNTVNTANTEQQSQVPDQQENTLRQDAQPIELSPLRVNTRVTLSDPLAGASSFQIPSLPQQIPELSQDPVLARYQHFVGKQEEALSLEVTPVSMQPSRQPSSRLIVQDEDGVVILKK